ncbi:hypothetical protein [Streptomyces sp. NPDC059215]|uniref:hypothetical protein n=1 Tax=Streptomyces sp. NPDC059215 TaxID=3346772 RepID=UPI0036B45115
MSDARVLFVSKFKELEHGNPDGPSLREAVRVEPSEKSGELVGYLRAGVVLAPTASLVCDVLSPVNAVIGGLQLLTDGRWCW